MVTVVVPLDITMAPPRVVAELLEKVLLVIVSVPSSAMAPPEPPAELLEKVLLVTVSVPPKFSMPPPLPDAAFP